MYEKIIDASEILSKMVHKTPLMSSNTFNTLTGFEVYFKCENFQKMGAFKFRGASNAIRKLTKEERKNGVITHSSGNHAQAIALAGKMQGIKTVIVMPHNAPIVKVNATKDYGAEIVFCEPSVVAREATTQKLINLHGYKFIHPYDNQDVIEGQGTATIEILEEIPELDCILTPVGGGGLLSGTGIVAKESKKVRLVLGAEPLGANDTFLSFQTKSLVPQTNPKTIADGLRTSLSKLTFNYIHNYVDEIVTVTEQEIIEAMRFLFERMKIVVEPSGAVPVAAVLKLSKENRENLPKGSKIAIIISGGNIDLSEFFKILENQIITR